MTEAAPPHPAADGAPTGAAPAAGSDGCTGAGVFFLW